MYVTSWVLGSSLYINFKILTTCTCHNKKSLRRTSPDVLTNRSGSLDGLVYIHLSKTVSLISVNKKTYQSVSLCEMGFSCYECWNFCFLHFDHVHSLQYLSLMIPICTPSATSRIAQQISSLDVYEKHTFRVALISE